ncbi:MAG: TolC family protein [Polyangiales bacterium]
MPRPLPLASVAAFSFAISALMALGVGRADPPPDAPRLSLDECLARAERTYPGLRAANHKILAAEAQLDEAWAAPFFPVNGTGLFSIAPTARGNPTFSPDAFGQNPFANETGFIARVSAETGVPISPWSWWRLGRVRDAARAGIRVSQEELTKARIELRANVRRAYWGLQFARDSLYLLDRATGYIRDAERYAQEGGADGGGPDTLVNDMRQIRVYRAEIRARRSEATRGERVARATLGLLTGAGDAIDIPDEPLCPLEMELRPLNTYLTRAQLNRPEVEMLRQGVAARRAAVDIQRGAYWPDLALALTASWSMAPTIADQPNPFAAGNSNFGWWGGAVVMRWNLEPVTNMFRVRRLSEELAMTEEQQRLALGGIALEVTDAYERARDAREREDAWGESEAAAEEWLSAVLQEYQSGIGELQQVISPLRQFLTARFSHLQAMHDLNGALLNLAVTTGQESFDARPSARCARQTPATQGDASVAAPVDASAEEEDELARILREAQQGPAASVDAGAPAGADVPAVRDAAPARPRVNPAAPPRRP